ncbi:MAG TPA: SRPBCC family protein [Chitinophagaceae bacterium]|jgi:hypothetical protein|nr:SRPBCC family protein [Chitinophagaceae bacterium]
MPSSDPVIIDITCTLRMERDSATVFRYLADLRLDARWRKEVHQTRIEPAEGRRMGVAVQDAYLSRRVPHHLTRLQCMHYEPGRCIAFETLPGSPFWQQTIRTVQPVPGGALVTYRLLFDAAVVRFGLGFPLPPFFIRWYTRTTMKRYLARLKTILEQSPIRGKTPRNRPAAAVAVPRKQAR